MNCSLNWYRGVTVPHTTAGLGYLEASLDRPSKSLLGRLAQCPTSVPSIPLRDALHDSPTDINIDYKPVLRIRIVYPGSEFFPSRIRIKEFKYLNPKKFVSKPLGNMIRNTALQTQFSVSVQASVADPGCLSRISDPEVYPFRIPDLGSRIQKQQQKRGVKKNLLSNLLLKPQISQN
jgi:hypothetical protein